MFQAQLGLQRYLILNSTFVDQYLMDCGVLHGVLGFRFAFLLFRCFTVSWFSNAHFTWDKPISRN